MSYADIMKGMALAGNGGGGGAALDYSTNEQATGVKWIDGKEIYCITYDRHESPVGHGGVVADISTLHIETLVNAETAIVYSDGLVTGGTGGRGVFTNGSNLTYYSGSQAGSLTYCTIWYTKTT